MWYSLFCLSKAATPAAEAAAPPPSWEAEATVEAEMMETKASMETEATVEAAKGLCLGCC